MSEARNHLHLRTCCLLFFVDYLDVYITTNRHMFSESFVEEFFNWRGVAVDFLREQRDNLERLNFLL